MDCTIFGAKSKALISFAVTAKLVCAFVFAYWYAYCRFSGAVAQILKNLMQTCKYDDFIFEIQIND